MIMAPISHTRRVTVPETGRKVYDLRPDATLSLGAGLGPAF